MSDEWGPVQVSYAMKFFYSMNKYLIQFVSIVEPLIATLVAFSILYFGISSVIDYLRMDWSDIDTFYQFISFALLLVVGVELIRLIIAHSISAVFELMFLIISRKMLSPTLDSQGMLFSVIAIAILFGISYIYTIKPLKSLDDLTS